MAYSNLKISVKILTVLLGLGGMSLLIGLFQSWEMKVIENRYRTLIEGEGGRRALRGAVEPGRGTVGRDGLSHAGRSAVRSG